MVPAPLSALDAEALRRWCGAALEGLRAARGEIDDLNVYPVPDGDTGTNLVLTMESSAAAVQAAVAELPAVARAMAHGALMGARGNSGVILSQLLKGIAEGLGEAATAGAQDLQRGLVRAVELGYAAVAHPVEGTVLTVAREAAAAAVDIEGHDLAAVARAARSGAAAALARTPDLLPQLRAAGVVDAGGRGLCVVLEALEQVVTGIAPAVRAVPSLLVPRTGGSAVRESGSDAFAYEVQFLLRDSTAAAVERLQELLGGLGDSLVVVGSPEDGPGGLWNVHVHVDDVGAAIEAGVEAGRPFRISVTRFEDQAAAPEEGSRTGRAVVAVAPGDGLAELFREAGATVVEGGPGACPSTAGLLAAIERSGAAEVVLLPNEGNVLATASAAAAAARDEGVAVAVVPTRSVLQGLSALAVADASRPLADDVASMAAAAGATRWAEVTVAVRDAVTTAGVCHAGDVLGLLEGDVALIGSDVQQVALELAARMVAGGGELVTVVVGADAGDGALDRLVTALERAHPMVDVTGYDGGQPHYPVLLAVE